MSSTPAIAEEIVMSAENPAGFVFRPVTVDDIATVVEFRTRMFRELGWRDDARLAEVEPLFSAYLAQALPSGECSGWIAEYGGAEGALQPAGTVVLVWQRIPPSVRNLAGIQAYALGMYVVPELRRRGVAHSLMTHVVECATDHGAPVIVLHASDRGQPLYAAMGFKLTTEMRLFTKHAAPPAWAVDDNSSD
jgi:GNAT superfamily N-acetyltransferase